MRLSPFHFSFSILGTEVFSVSLFTDEAQSLGYWVDDDDEDDEDDDGDDGDGDGDDDPDPTDAMLDTLNEIVRWEDHGQG